MAIDLDDTMLLSTCERYAAPEDKRAIIPRIYGDFLSTLVIPNDNDDGGFLPAVSIDRLNWVFALNDAPIPATPAPKIYVNDTLQDPSVYFFAPSIDYEGHGHPIAAIQFLVSPGTRSISWRGYGTESGGVLIDNPLYAIYDAFSAYGNWTLDDIDWPTSFETFRTLTELGAQMRWAFWAQRTYREWLTEILRGYHTDHFETEAGKLAMVLDRGILGISVSVLNTIDAQTDLEGTEDDIEFEVDEANIVNTLTVKRRLKWTSNEYTDEPTVDYRPSVGLYGTLRDEVELPAVYTDSHGLIWVQAYFARYGYLPAIVRFTVRGLGYATALPGTYLGFTWPWIGWDQARLIKVLNQEVDPVGERISFEAFDCGRFVTDAVTLPTVPITEVRRRIRVMDTSVDLQPPAAASSLVATGSYRRIVLAWTPPGDLDYDHTEIWAASVNNRASATFIRNGGYKGQLCQEAFDVGDAATYYVWLMTVDESGNGKNGTGNWYPASATAGVVATSVLVATGGIQTTAVTFTHQTNASVAPATYLGETTAADAYLDGLFAQGDVIAFGSVPLNLGSLQTAILQIRRGGALGPVIGVNYLANILNSQVTVRVDCWGLDFNPAWNGFYALTIQVIGQSGAQQTFFVQSGSSLFLRQTKR